jgi:hypothetical protein
MAEQELRDHIAASGWTIAYINHFDVGNMRDQSRAEIVILGHDTLAMCVVRDGQTVSGWGIYTYAHAANVIAWADAGGNWAEEVRR